MRGRRFDALMLFLCAVLVVGGHLLVWANNHELITGNELFSVWALPLYVGFGMAAYVLFLWRTDRRATTGRATERRGLPPTYQAALVGSVLFIVGVVAELAWRSIGGDLPSGPESVLSPARMALFGAALLLLSGPIASVVRRLRDQKAEEPSRADLWLLAIGLGLALAVVTLLTGFVHPFVVEAGAANDEIDQPLQTTTDIYLIRLDGSGTYRLTTTPTDYEAHPAVNPDGTRIAFARGLPEDYRIYTMAINGSDARRLTNTGAHEDGPLWIPGADTISYSSPVEPGVGSGQPTSRPAPAPGPSANAQPVDLTGLGIWTVGSAGGPPRLVSSRGGEGVESWAPDGRLFCGWNFQSGSFDVGTGDLATGTRTAVATGPSQEWSCTLSPDGSRIAFHSDRDGDFDIYSMASDGSDLRQLTDDPEIDQLPRFSPDGTRLAFISSRSGEFEIYVGNVDLSGIQDVSNDPALDDGFMGFGWLPDGSALVAASSGRAYPSGASDQTVPLGVAALVLQALLLALALTTAFRFAPNAAGIATIIGTVSGLLATLMGNEPLFALVPVAAGLAVDVVVSRTPALTGVGRWSVIAAVGSAVFVIGYFLILFVTRGIGWSWDLVLGSSILAVLLAVAVASVAPIRGEQSEPATIP